MINKEYLDRKALIRDLDQKQKQDEKAWWWAVGIAAAVVLAKLVIEVGPIVFPNHLR